VRRSALLSTVALVAVGLTAWLWVRQCAGPDPEVVSVTIEPPAAEGEPYVVRAVVADRRGREGTVSVTIGLRERSTGREYLRHESISLDPGAEVGVTAEFDVPPGDYEPLAKVRYPPG
jgi:hypothetical protein